MTLDPFNLPESLNLAEVFLSRQAATQPAAPALYFEDQVSIYDCGGTDAYLGDPAGATAAEGHRLFEILADVSAAAIRELLT